MTAVPAPQGRYVPAARIGELIYTAGMTPRKDGKLIREGQIKAATPIADLREAVRLAAENALTAARSLLTEGETIKVVSMNVYLNAEAALTHHAALADHASDYLHEELGEAGIGSRAAIGVASLPGGSPVEIQLIVAVSPI